MPCNQPVAHGRKVQHDERVECNREGGKRSPNQRDSPRKSKKKRMEKGIGEWACATLETIKALSGVELSVLFQSADPMAAHFSRLTTKTQTRRQERGKIAKRKQQRKQVENPGTEIN